MYLPEQIQDFKAYVSKHTGVWESITVHLSPPPYDDHDRRTPYLASVRYVPLDKAYSRCLIVAMGKSAGAAISNLEKVLEQISPGVQLPDPKPIRHAVANTSP